MMHIAIAGIAHETNPISTVRTRQADFSIRRGAAILEEPGFPQLLQRLQVEPVPILYAYALPSGPVVAEDYLALRAEIIAGLASAGPLDGILLILHGAMWVEGIGDGETDLLRAIRAQVGNDLLIAARLDLHGNMTADFVAATDILVAYRTAPHRDMLETRDRALKLLVAAICEQRRPCTVMVRVPLLITGEQAITEVEPMASLMARLPEVDAQPGISAASIMVGFAWADVPDASASVLVAAEDVAYRAAAYAQARRLAQAMWDRRAGFGFDVPALPVDDAIRAALSAPESTVFLSDSGDNPTAGAAGDVPFVLERLLALRVPDAVFAAIADAEATAQCYAAGVGATVDLTVGGKLDSINGRPLAIRGEIVHLTPEAAGVATVRVDGIRVILTRERRTFTCLADFREVGVEPLAHKIIVIKLGYLFPELRDVAPRTIMALSPGFADQNLLRIPYRHVRRPIYPLDRDMTWTPPEGEGQAAP